MPRRAALRRLLLRAGQAVPILLIVAVLTFLLLQLLPGDPAQVIAGSDATPEAVARIRTQLGLDRPLWEQLARWGWGLLQGDFGKSLTLNQPVLTAVAERLPITLSLSLLSMAITLPAGIGLGMAAAYWRGTWIDSAVMVAALVGLSVPGFWVGILSIILFSVVLGWVPSGGYIPLRMGVGPWLSALVLPAIVLALFQIGFLARMTRSAMLDILDQDYIRAARARGVGEWWTVMRHAFRNALITVVTVSGIILSLLIGGSVIIEQVFSLPGIGRLVVQGIMSRDYPLVQGTMLLFGLAFVVVNLLIDMLYGLVDPRVSTG